MRFLSEAIVQDDTKEILFMYFFNFLAIKLCEK